MSYDFYGNIRGSQPSACIYWYRQVHLTFTSYAKSYLDSYIDETGPGGDGARLD